MMKEPLTREKLITKIQNTNTYILTMRNMLEKACERLDISAKDAESIHHLMGMLRFHQDILKTQLATFEELFGEEFPHE